MDATITLKVQSNHGFNSDTPVTPVKIHENWS